MRACFIYLAPLLISILSATTRRRGGVHDSMRRIMAYCAHIEPHSEWLECDRTTDGKQLRVAWSSKGNGLVLPGRINHKKLEDVHVYRSDSISQLGVPKRGWAHIELHAPVRVILQVLKERVGAVGAANVDAACFYRFASGEPVGPASYIVREKRTGFLHPILELAHLEERLDGDTVWQLLNRMNRDDVVEIAGLSLDILNEKASIQGALQALQRELRTRILRRLSLVDAAVETALELWRAGLTHCDSYPRNVVVLKRYAQSVAEVEQLLEKHAEKIYVFPSLQGWDRLSGQEKQKVVAQRGIIEYSRLDHQSMRYIDTGKMVELIPLLKEINRTEYPDDADSLLLAPCAVYRMGARSDLEAMVGEVVEDGLAVYLRLNWEITHRLRQGTPVFESCAKSEGGSTSWSELCEALGILDKRRNETTELLELAALKVREILDKAGCARMRQLLRNLQNVPPRRARWKAALETWGVIPDRSRGTLLGRDNAAGMGKTNVTSHESPRDNKASKQSSKATNNYEATENVYRRMYQNWQKTAKQRLRKRCSLYDMKAAAAEIRSIIQNTSDRIRSTFTADTEKEKQRKQMKHPQQPMPRGKPAVFSPGRIKLVDHLAWKRLRTSKHSATTISPTVSTTFNVTNTRRVEVKAVAEPLTQPKSMSQTKLIANTTRPSGLARVRLKNIEAFRRSRRAKSNLMTISPTELQMHNMRKIRPSDIEAARTKPKSPPKTQLTVRRQTRRLARIRLQDIEAFRKSRRAMANLVSASSTERSMLNVRRIEAPTKPVSSSKTKAIAS